MPPRKEDYSEKLTQNKLTDARVENFPQLYAALHRRRALFCAGFEQA
jgi:hypothetical protein